MGMTTVRPVTRLASVRLAPNPGPMTLDGTNSYVLRDPSGPGCVVVDPGPNDEAHLRELADQDVALVLITHQHHDHTDGAARLHEFTGAPVRAASAEHCHGSAPVLRDGERLEIAGVAIDVVATPGHTADSVSFHLPDDAPLDTAPAAPSGAGSVLTGDTVLGRGSTVIGIPDGTLAQYLASLRTLASLGDGPGGARTVIGLPAHGPTIDDLAERCRAYLDHRLRRLDEVRAALGRLGLTADRAQDDAGIEALLRLVYPDVEPGVEVAAAFAVATQVAYLAAE